MTSGLLARIHRQAAKGRRHRTGWHHSGNGDGNTSPTGIATTDSELEIVKFKSMVLIVTCHDAQTATTLVEKLEQMTALQGSNINKIGAVITITEPANSALWQALKSDYNLVGQKTIGDLIAFINAAKMALPTAAAAPIPTVR